LFFTHQNKKGFNTMNHSPDVLAALYNAVNLLTDEWARHNPCLPPEHPDHDAWYDALWAEEDRLYRILQIPPPAE
jgi:hypothetical protein